MVSSFTCIGPQKYSGGALPPQPLGFQPFDLSRNETDTAAVYGLLRFDGGEKTLLGMTYKGNIGAQLVRIENQGSGFFHQNASVFSRNGVVTAIDTSEQTRAGGRDFS